MIITVIMMMTRITTLLLPLLLFLTTTTNNVKLTGKKEGQGDASSSSKSTRLEYLHSTMLYSMIHSKESYPQGIFICFWNPAKLPSHYHSMISKNLTEQQKRTRRTQGQKNPSQLSPAFNSTATTTKRAAKEA